MNADEESLGWAHPAFLAHFVDPVYEDPAGEFAPFGTDEGANLLAEWSERVEELTDDDLTEAAFTLLRLFGRVDLETWPGSDDHTDDVEGL